MNKLLIPMIVFSLLCGCTSVPPVDKEDQSTPVPEVSVEPEEEIVSTPVPTPEPVVMRDPITLPGFVTFWDLGCTDGSAYLENTYDKIVVSVDYPGTANDAVQVYHDALPLVKGTGYQVSFDLSSTVDRSVEALMINNDTGHVLHHQTFHATAEPVHYEFSFRVKEGTSWNGRLAFNAGSPSQEMPYHQISISNLILRETVHPVSEPTIKTDHLGYLPHGEKKVVLPYEQGDFIQVLDTATQQVVLQAPVVREIRNESTGETNFTADFSSLETPGTYQIRSQLNGFSHPFEIRDDLVLDLMKDSVRMFFYQRCGRDLPQSMAGKLAHGPCHTQLAQVFDSDQLIDVSGGWHDAGDYGRYVVTGAKAAMDLMLAYTLDPQDHGDETLIPESNNGTPDILDEVRIELDWLLKMQNSWGGVYDKVVPVQFADFIMPDKDQQPLIVMPETTTAEGDFVAVMALASLIYEPYDPDFAHHCLQQAEMTWAYLQNATLIPYTNPAEISAGQYLDKVDTDERYTASCALYAVTGQQKYLDNVRQLFHQDPDLLNGISWKKTGTYGTYLILKYSDLEKEDPYFHHELLSHFIRYAESILDAASADGYFVSLYNNYSWGSNADLADHGLILALSNDLMPNVNYRNSAADHLHYLLGRNSLDFCFVTGAGIHSPHHPHHRPSVASRSLIPGALVGGANRALEDPVAARTFNEKTPAARCYIDDAGSFSTNEIAIYWNSSLAALLSAVSNNDR